MFTVQTIHATGKAYRAAWAYDYIAAFVSLNRWKFWRVAALEYIHGSDILELGFGTGHLQVELIKHNFHAIGLDESWQMAEVARKNILNNHLQPLLMCGVAQFLPFSPKSLDGIIATFPSEYMMDNRTLLELERVLKPTGQIVIIPMAWLGGHSLQDSAARWLFKITGQTPELTISFENKISRLLNQVGFEVQIIKKTIQSDIVMIIIAEKYK